VLALALAALLPVLPPTPPTLAAAPAETVRIDGVLDEAAWADAEVATGFVQFEPVEGVPATDRTEVRVLRTPTGLVIGARMWADEVRTLLSRRDSDGDADQFVVGLDSYNDGRTAYLFGLTAAGVQQDAILDGDDDDDSWDAVWTSAARVLPDGWVAEMEIPYSQLRFTEGGDSWGLQFQRVSPARGEESFWSPFTRAEANGGLVRLFGRLEGLSGIRPQPVLQAIPYSLAGGSRREADAAPGTAAYGFEGNVGADVKVGLSSNVTLDATVNPDFGQVEADPAQLNLGTFEVIFQERRPFFTEGTQIFDLTVGTGRDGALLYTRRIGGASPIIAATKLSGRTPGGLSFGALGAATGDDFAPGRGYLAARVKQEFPGQSYVGAGATAFASDADGTPMAVAGAADWEVRTLGGTWVLEGSAAASTRSEGGARTSGGALYVGFDKVEGYVTPGFGVRLYSDGFELNDVGRFRQTDLARLTGGTRVLWNQGGTVGPFRRLSSFAFFSQEWSLSDGVNRGFGGFFRTGAEFPGFQELGASLNVDGVGGFDVRETRGLGAVRNLRDVSGGVEYESDSRRRFQWELGVRSGADEGGGVRYGVGAELDWTASDRVRLGLEAGVGAGDRIRAWAANEAFFVTDAGVAVGAEATTPDDVSEADLVYFDAEPGLLDGLAAYAEPTAVAGTAYYAPVFGARDTREIDLTTRAQVIFGPGLSLQLYGQLFAARGRFRDLAVLAGPDDLRPAAAFPKRRDFAFASFNANAVLRWEYRPGSTLFIVYSQGRDESVFEEALLREAGRSPYDRRSVETLGDAFDAFPTDVFLVKLSYLIMR
jgi:hypothetical protein